MKMANYGVLLSMVMAAALPAAAQAQKAPPAAVTPAAASAAEDISGMYSFERDGEFVQINVEPAATVMGKPGSRNVTGFISRYGDADSDSGAFLDYFISKGSLDEQGKISFTTKTVHGVWFQFAGKVVRGGAKSRNVDGYFQLQGTLTRSVLTPKNAGDTSTASAKSREITMKLMPSLDLTSTR